MEGACCPACREGSARYLFTGRSPGGKEYRLVRCARCGLRYLDPLPAPGELESCYGEEYFTKRTDRGYDGYFTGAVRAEIERVTAMNLRDLGFEAFEKRLGGPGRALDIGCAAGYFVEYLSSRGWRAAGIDVSRPCVDNARSRGLDVEHGDYLQRKDDAPFDLVTLWASIEHLPGPDLFIGKIAAELAPGGMLYISTCRVGGIGFQPLFGERWRFYNFPEHVCFFSRKALFALLARNGLAVRRYFTYGSGFGKGGSVTRKLADTAAKRLRLGDMMVVAAEKAGG